MTSGLIFYYGAMGCSKTANALIQNFQYNQTNKVVWLIKPSIDTRDDDVDENGKAIPMLKSRIGINARAMTIEPDDSIYRLYKMIISDVIIADEAQFFTEYQIEELKNIADKYEIPVICYGLRTDFQTKLFPGSKRLFELADEIHEIASVCHCGNKAMVNARFDENGEIVLEGEQVVLGGNDTYQPICWQCYRDKRAKKK